MMKEKYISPEMIVIELECENIVVTSAGENETENIPWF